MKLTIRPSDPSPEAEVEISLSYNAVGDIRVEAQAKDSPSPLRTTLLVITPEGVALRKNVDTSLGFRLVRTDELFQLPSF